VLVKKRLTVRVQVFWDVMSSSSLGSGVEEECQMQERLADT